MSLYTTSATDREPRSSPRSSKVCPGGRTGCPTDAISGVDLFAESPSVLRDVESRGTGFFEFLTNRNVMLSNVARQYGLSLGDIHLDIGGQRTRARLVGVLRTGLSNLLFADIATAQELQPWAASIYRPNCPEARG